MMESIHMKNNSQIRWKTKLLKFDRSENRSQCKVPSNQVAKSLIANGKEEKQKNPTPPKIKFSNHSILNQTLYTTELLLAINGPKKWGHWC